MQLWWCYSPLFLIKEIKIYLLISVKTVIIPVMVKIEKRFHPFPFRTRKLSFSSPNILGWTRPGKSGHRHRIIKTTAWGGFFVAVFHNYYKNCVQIKRELILNSLFFVFNCNNFFKLCLNLIVLLFLLHL